MEVRSVGNSQRGNNDSNSLELHFRDSLKQSSVVVLTVLVSDPVLVCLIFSAFPTESIRKGEREGLL